MHTNSVYAFKKICLPYFNNTMRILEIGPDKFPSTFETICEGKFKQWHTLDMYSSGKLTYKNINDLSFPINNNAYDIILAANVLEHVRKPWLWIKELARVCNNNGIIICINPVSWHYHEAPIDCFRYYPEGMKSIFEEADLEILENQFGNFQFNLSKFKRTIQGVDKQFAPWKMKFMQITGYPFEYASDIVTIGKK